MRRKRAMAEDTIVGGAGSGLVVLSSAHLSRPRGQRGRALVGLAEPAQAPHPTVGRWELAKRRSLVDIIVAELAGMVASGELQDGDVLPCQRDLARILGVSRTPLREALNRLIGMGLVQVRQGSGTFITSDGVADPARWTS